MKQTIQTPSQNANIINETFELSIDSTPLYVGLLASDLHKTCLTFPLTTSCSDFANASNISLSIYLKKLTTASTFTEGQLHIGILSSGNKASSMLPTQVTASISNEMVNSYVTFNLFNIIRNYRNEILNLIIFPDPELDALCSFEPIDSIHPPFLTIYPPCDWRTSGCDTPFLIEGPPGPQGIQGIPGPNGGPGILDTFAQLYNPSFTTTVTVPTTVTPVPFALANSGENFQYTTGEFAISTTNVENDTFQFEKTGMYLVTVTFVFSFIIPLGTINNDGFVTIFTVQNTRNNYTQSLLYEGTVAYDAAGDSASFQKTITALLNVPVVPDGIYLSLVSFDFNLSVTNPTNLSVGNIVISAIRISNPLPESNPLP